MADQLVEKTVPLNMAESWKHLSVSMLVYLASGMPTLGGNVGIGLAERDGLRLGVIVDTTVEKHPPKLFSFIRTCNYRLTAVPNL